MVDRQTMHGELEAIYIAAKKINVHSCLNSCTHTAVPGGHNGASQVCKDHAQGPEPGDPGHVLEQHRLGRWSFRLINSIYLLKIALLWHLGVP